ncbi:hypothetical protein [Pseudohongiella sp. O18]|uniref:hypothetical protein n=1 Tax=Pseudohongiella sp. O18 TaxID=2904248 RepID=UPI001F2C4F6E|nr:hypothetical protein [Pseudohongiella sp. O18]
MSFLSDMNRITKRISSDVDQLGRAVKMEVFSGVILDTRVDTGRARGNWQASENVPMSGEVDRLDTNGSAVIDEVSSKINGISLSYLTNNLPYIGVLEEKDAMVARNVQRVQSNLNRMAAQIRK